MLPLKLKNLFSPSKQEKTVPMTSRDQGIAGEELALTHLKKKGYRLLEKNYRTRLGEIDLIMSKEESVIFVEVKYRKKDNYGQPFEAVTPAKQKKIARAAISYIKAKGLKNRLLRFDIVSVISDKIEHLENAFAPEPKTYTL